MDGWGKLIQEHLGTALGALIAGLAGAFGVSKVRRAVKQDSKDGSTDDAVMDVITLLREEVSRLTEQNSKLQNLVHQLNDEIAHLRAEQLRLKTLLEMRTRTGDNHHGRSSDSRAHQQR